MSFDAQKLAYCGIYCAQCAFVVACETGKREHLYRMPQKYHTSFDKDLSEIYCPGCKNENLCGECAIRECAIEKGIDCCADCEMLPCKKIQTFANDGIPHHLWAFQTLSRIKAVGREIWFSEFCSNLQCECG